MHPQECELEWLIFEAVSLIENYKCKKFDLDMQAGKALELMYKNVNDNDYRANQKHYYGDIHNYLCKAAYKKFLKFASNYTERLCQLSLRDAVNYIRTHVNEVLPGTLRADEITTRMSWACQYGLEGYKKWLSDAKKNSSNSLTPTIKSDNRSSNTASLQLEEKTDEPVKPMEVDSGNSTSSGNSKKRSRDQRDSTSTAAAVAIDERNREKKARTESSSPQEPQGSANPLIEEATSAPTATI